MSLASPCRNSVQREKRGRESQDLECYLQHAQIPIGFLPNTQNRQGIRYISRDLGVVVPVLPRRDVKLNVGRRTSRTQLKSRGERPMRRSRIPQGFAVLFRQLLFLAQRQVSHGPELDQTGNMQWRAQPINKSGVYFLFFFNNNGRTNSIKNEL